MPWANLFRLFATFALVRWIRNRQRGGGPTAHPPRNLGAQIAAVREGASLLTQAVVTAGLLLAAALLATAGTSSAVLSPRWLGGVLLGLALVFAILGLLEARRLRRAVLVRRHRRDAARLTRQV